MGEFRTLLKYEMKKHFPAIFQKGKKDVVGFVFSAIFTLVIVGVCVFLMSTIAKNYISIKLDKVADKVGRAYELLNMFYNIILISLVFVCLEGMRKSFVKSKDEKIFLCLPIKQQNLFLSKLLVQLIINYITTLFIILPINLIIFMVLKPNFLFWFTTLFVWLVMPIIVMMISSLLIIPYIKIINFIKTRYLLLFISLSVLLIAVFIIYTVLLKFLQNYLETGLIKFLFNEQFILTLRSMLKITYPANCFAGIVLGKDLLISYLVCFALVGLSLWCIYCITKRLYNVTLYQDQVEVPASKKVSKAKAYSPLFSLIKKEFITVFREPRYMFAYFVIAVTMPVMVYCCYTLLESLLLNMFGFHFSFELALLVMLMFSVLTNTFCATNITREGRAFLRQKTLPIKADVYLGAKIIFCNIVSVCSNILSSVLLIVATSVTFWNGIVCGIISIVFAFSQIFIATKLDLICAKIVRTRIDEEKQNTRTISKIITIGFAIALIVGLGSLVLGMLSKGILNIKIHVCFVYIIPALASCIYLLLAVLYYKKNLQKTFDKVVL